MNDKRKLPWLFWASIALNVLLILYMLFWGKGSSIVGDPEKAIEDQLISISEADSLENDYVMSRYRVINESLGYEDDRNFWFSMTTMENYIAYVKKESDKNGYKNLGLRIYNAAYPKESDKAWPKPGYSTVVIVPTYDEEYPERSGFMPMPPPPPADAASIKRLNYAHGGN